MNRIFVEPLDVLMFRSERPFVVRETHIAKTGVISPSNFEGAIKSSIFFDFCKEKGYSPTKFQRIKDRRGEEGEEGFIKRILEEAKKDKDLENILKLIGHPALGKSEQLIVRGAFFANKGEFIEHFPMPNDIIKEDKEKGKTIKLQPSESIKRHVDDEELSLMLSECVHVKSMDGFMKFNELERYLNGETPKARKIKYRSEEVNKPYFKETRTGIQLKKGRKKTEEGAIYTAEFLRLIENWGFIVWYEVYGKELPEKRIMRLGGEGRGATFEKLYDRNLDFSRLIDKINEEKKFKLYLATSSLFADGWKPPINLLERVFGVRLNLISALPGKPVYIGGYDFALNKEKPLRKWVNSGAVYYFRFEGEIKRDLPLPIKILEENIDMRCAFIGRW